MVAFVLPADSSKGRDAVSLRTKWPVLVCFGHHRVSIVRWFSSSCDWLVDGARSCKSKMPNSQLRMLHRGHAMFFLFFCFFCVLCNCVGCKVGHVGQRCLCSPSAGISPASLVVPAARVGVPAASRLALCLQYRPANEK